MKALGVTLVFAWCLTPLGGLADEPRFVDFGDTVFDRMTGLEWEKQPLYDDDRTWVQALNDCLTSTKAGGGWRLPNVKELVSIVDYEGNQGKGSSVCWWYSVFEGSCGWYWSSTPVPWSSSSAFNVSFNYGNVSYGDIGYGYGVRCVRAGQ